MAAEDQSAPRPDLPPAPDRRTVVTRRPGRGSPALVVIALVGTLAVAWIMSRADETRARWDSGAPVLVTVSGVVTDTTSVVTEYGTSRSWSVRTSDLERTGAAELGSQLQARLTGDCRCELILQEPDPVPRWTLGAMLLLGVAAVPGLLARRRWRRLRTVLAGRSRPVVLEPVWLRRPIGPTVWAARFPTAGPQGAEPVPERDPEGVVVELAGTPASWFPSDGTPVEVYGPDPESGLTVFRSEAGMAVASSAARSGPSVASRVLPWSGALARATGLVPPPEPRSIDVGGATYQRVSVDAGGDRGSEASMVLRSDTSRKKQGLLVVAIYAVWILAFQTIQPSAPLAAAGVAATVVVLWALRRALAGRLADSQPFAGWPDRGAARDAALAAAALGFVPSTFVPARGAPENA